MLYIRRVASTEQPRRLPGNGCSVAPNTCPEPTPDGGSPQTGQITRSAREERRTMS